MTQPMPICENCRYFTGCGCYCRRHAPVILPKWRAPDEPVTHWPAVNTWQWCGDWELKPIVAVMETKT